MNPPIAGPNGSQPVQLPHDIYGFLPISWPWWVYGIGLPAVVLLALGGYQLVRYLKRRRTSPEVPTIDPWDTLIGRLQSMTAPADFPPGRTQEDHYFALSLLLREAIERRTKIPATDLTFQELRTPLRQKLPLATAETERVIDFLERADLVKFAGLPSQREEAETWRANLSAWVQELRPKSIDVSPWEKDALEKRERDSGLAQQEAAR